MVMHPQGFYLALINTYKTKKNKAYAVELFDFTTSDSMVPHQQIHVDREIHTFTGVYWEPNHHKLAVHTLAAKKFESGRANYQVNAQRHGVDIYEMHHDKQTGFCVKLIGYHPAEKVSDLDRKSVV